MFYEMNHTATLGAEMKMLPTETGTLTSLNTTLFAKQNTSKASPRGLMV